MWRRRRTSPNVIPALQQEIIDIRNEAASYGSLGAVPADMQANVQEPDVPDERGVEAAGEVRAEDECERYGDALGNYKKFLDKSTRFIPTWVKVAVALALGLGTMVGWKRIVVTVGEKIGKTHLTYAQGASAEIMAMVHDRAGGWAWGFR